MNQMVSPLALELHQAYKARQANYLAISLAPKVEERLKLIAHRREKTRVERFQATMAKNRAEREQRALRICQAATAFAYGVALAMTGRTVRSNIKIHNIQLLVANSFGITMDDMLSHRRTYANNTPRQISMYLAKKLTLRTLPEIGRCFHRDHSTVMHGVSKITAMMAADEVFRAKVEELRAAVTGRVG